MPPLHPLWRLLWGIMLGSLPVLFGALPTLAQNATTRHFTTDEGLLENTPYALFEDRGGQLWIGTRGGLCWYDGHRFHAIEQGQVAEDQSATALATAPDGTLWLGHYSGGLSWRRGARFHPFLPRGFDRTNWVQCLHWTDAHTLWIGTEQGLFRCRFGATDTTLTHLTPVAGQPNVRIYGLCPGPPGWLLVATQAGLTLMETRTGQGHPTGLPALFAGVDAKSVSRVNDTLFWVAGIQLGLVRLSCAPAGAPGVGGRLQAPAWRTRRYTQADGLCSDAILNAIQDRAGRVWALASAGLSRLDPAGGITCFPNDEPGRDFPAALLEDREGNLWSGLGADGIRQRLSDERFTYYTAHGLPKGGITAVEEADAGTYWLATQQGTLAFRPAAPPDQQVTFLPPVHAPTDAFAPTDRFVYSLCRDAQGQLWQGSISGAARYDATARRWHPLDQVPGLAHQTVCSIVPDRRGRLWFSTLANGVTRYDPATGVFHTFSETDPAGPRTLRCWKLFRDARGEIWLGTEGAGLLRLDTDHDVFRAVAGSERFTGLVGIADDWQGGLWLVARNLGLLHFDGHRLRPYRYQRHLPHTSVRSAVADHTGRVWLGTSQGLDSFDPRTGQVARYGGNDGFFGHGAVTGVALLARSGQLWIGTQQGLMRHDPTLARPNRVAPLTRLTGLRLLMHDTTAQSGLTLPHQLNQLSFAYLGLSLTSPDQVRYRHRLRGFDTQWVGPLAATEATYTNLPPGTYTFEVKAANGDGVWNARPATFAFTIRPPWWRTWWAYALYAGLLGLALYAARTYTLSRERLRNDLALERLAMGHLKELDKVKTNFFTNISHEFRTPLTLILGPAEELATDHPDGATRRTGGLILRNAQRLLRLINQLLDLSKLEAGAMQLTPTRGDIAPLARQLAATFASMAEAQGTGFRTEGPVRLPFVFDADKLEIILTNLLSNALRFTPAGGEVSLSWHEAPAADSRPAGVELTVRDTGPGIAAQHLPQLFDRFYQGAHPTLPGAQPGTGVGLTLVKELAALHGGTVAVRSKSGEGAAFVVFLPAGLVAEPLNSPAPVAHADTAPKPENILSPPPPPAEEALPAPQAEAEADMVLFIEDNDDVREFIRASLAPAGYRLLEAPDGRQGVEVALTEVPDLIISDVMMPGLDGYGVVRHLKAHPATSHIPIVLLTAKSAATDRLEGLETGADAYLGKPFAARELRAQVRNLLALRDRARAYLRPPQALTQPTMTTTLEAVAAPPPLALAPLDQAFLAKVAAAVEANLADGDFDVDQLSSAVAMSRTQMQRKLRALTGQAPAEYIRFARLQRALELLRARTGTIAEIGYQVGFNNPAHFSTVFSRQFGYPPSEAARQ